MGWDSNNIDKKNNIVENMAKEINDNKLHLLEVRCAASLSIKISADQILN